MKSHAKQQQPASRVIESNPRAANQPPLTEILQAYRKTTMPIQRFPKKKDEGKPEDSFYVESRYPDVELIPIDKENKPPAIFRLVGTEQTIYWIEEGDKYQIKLSDGSFIDFDIDAYSKNPQFLDFLTLFKEVSKATSTETDIDTRRALQMHVLQKFLSNALYTADEIDKMHYQTSPLNFQEGGSYIRSEATAFVDALKEFLNTGIKTEYLHLVQQLDFNEILGQFTTRFPADKEPEMAKTDEIAQFLIDRKSLKGYVDAYSILFADTSAQFVQLSPFNSIMQSQAVFTQTKSELTTFATDVKKRVQAQVMKSLINKFVEINCKDPINKESIKTEFTTYFNNPESTEFTASIAYLNEIRKKEHEERIDSLLNEKDTIEDNKLEDFYKEKDVGSEINDYKKWVKSKDVKTDREIGFINATKGDIPVKFKTLIKDQSFSDFLRDKKNKYIPLTKDKIPSSVLFKELDSLNKVLTKNLSEILIVGGSIDIPGEAGIKQPGFFINPGTSKSLIELVKHTLNKTGYVPTPTAASKKMLAMGKSLQEIIEVVAEKQKNRIGKKSTTLAPKMNSAINVIKDFKVGDYIPIVSSDTAGLLTSTIAAFEEFKKLGDEQKEYIKLEASAVIKLLNELKMLDKGSSTPGIALAELQVNLQDAIANKDNITAYIRNIQNIHELIILELERKPAIAPTPLPLVASQLPAGAMQPHYTDYGLKAFTQAYNAALVQSAGHTPFVVDSYSNIYFELLQKLHDTKIASGGKTEVRDSQTLPEEYKKGLVTNTSEPNLIMVDIHPNDASKPEMRKNDIVAIIESRLKDKSAEKRLTVIVDITLNHVADDEVKGIIESVKPYINSKQLNLVFIQSLTKFTQLGMDKHSGGLMFHYNSGSDDWKAFNESIEKSAKNAVPDTIRNYFDLLFKAASEEQKTYIQLVRKNTKYVYDQLKEKFLSQQIEKGHTFDLSLNEDEGTCYVAFNYKELSARLFAGKEDRDSETEMLGKRILNEGIYNVINKLKLPLSMRQSFGFPISNLGEAWVGSRFTIGIEEKEMLKQYVDIVTYVRLQICNLTDNSTLKNDRDRITAFKKFADNISTIEELKLKLEHTKQQITVLPSPVEKAKKKLMSLVIKKEETDQTQTTDKD